MEDSMSGTEPAATANLNAVGFSLSFTVNDLSRSLQFYTDGLGFEVHDRHEADGQLRFVQLKAGTVQIGLGQDDFAKGRDRVKGVGFRTWIVTSDDLFGLAERAKAAGITLDNEPEELPWGGMAFAVTDPDGFKLSIASAG
jgi:catechol 2,3-dioxygenase-like lactoylglutathione lyase family enzyme